MATSHCSLQMKWVNKKEFDSLLLELFLPLSQNGKNTVFPLMLAPPLIVAPPLFGTLKHIMSPT